MHFISATIKSSHLNIEDSAENFDGDAGLDIYCVNTKEFAGTSHKTGEKK